MEWSYKWSEDYKSGFYGERLLKGHIKEGDLEPCLDGLEYYLIAFRELDTSRPSGLDIARIPFTAIADYFTIYPSGEFEEFHYVVRRMDEKWCELAMDEQKRKANAAKK